MTHATTAISPRDAAREWIAETLRAHLHPDLQTCGDDRIREVAERVEAEAHESNMPVEMTIELGIEWCENQNEEAGLRVAV